MGIESIIGRYDLRLLVIFGSYGTQRYTLESDLDLGYLADKPLQIEDEKRLLTDLVFHFKKDRIDLINLHKANSLLLYEVASKGRVLYDAGDSFLRFKIKAFARYTETKFLRDKRRDYLLKTP